MLRTYWFLRCKVRRHTSALLQAAVGLDKRCQLLDGYRSKRTAADEFDSLVPRTEPYTVARDAKQNVSHTHVLYEL